MTGFDQRAAQSLDVRFSAAGSEGNLSGAD
jgi:hypothetical protein